MCSRCSQKAVLRKAMGHTACMHQVRLTRQQLLHVSESFSLEKGCCEELVETRICIARKVKFIPTHQINGGEEKVYRTEKGQLGFSVSIAAPLKIEEAFGANTTLESVFYDYDNRLVPSPSNHREGTKERTCLRTKMLRPFSSNE